MDLSSLFAGLLFGVPIGMVLLYLLTHPEFRAALGSRLHSGVDAIHVIHAKISAAMQNKPPPPAAPPAPPV